MAFVNLVQPGKHEWKLWDNISHLQFITQLPYVTTNPIVKRWFDFLIVESTVILMDNTDNDKDTCFNILWDFVSGVSYN